MKLFISADIEGASGIPATQHLFLAALADQGSGAGRFARRDVVHVPRWRFPWDILRMGWSILRQRQGEGRKADGKGKGGGPRRTRPTIEARKKEKGKGRKAKAAGYSER